MAKLSKRQRDRARNLAAEAALLGYRKREHIGYSQGPRRWQGIDDRRSAARGEIPFWADCSAFATWCLWNGLYLPYRKPDRVNGCQWRAGFTGTQLRHGRKVSSGHLARGDLVFYATAGSTPTHVAICVGRKNGRAMVVSHGSTSGPLYLPWNYRRVIGCRRYVFDGV